MRQLRGFLAWIAYPTAAALVDWRIAAVSALAIATLVFAAGRRSPSIDTFAVAAIAFFAALTIVSFVQPASGVQRFVGALTPAALGVAALVSIAIRQPFTVPFARRVAPGEFWNTPMFMHINVVLSAVWATSFVAIAVVTATVLTLDANAGLIIVGAQILGFVIPMRICRSYPATVRARAIAA